MSFMRQEIEKGSWWRVNDDNGAFCYPWPMVTHAEVRAMHPTADRDDIELLHDMVGARMAAPGFMDQTEWSVFATEEEARAFLEEMYGEECEDAYT